MSEFEEYVETRNKQVTEILTQILQRANIILNNEGEYDKQEIQDIMTTLIKSLPYVPASYCEAIQNIYRQLYTIALLTGDGARKGTNSEIRGQKEKVIEERKTETKEQIIKEYAYLLTKLEETSIYTIQQVPTIQKYIQDVFPFLPREELTTLQTISRLAEELTYKTATLYKEM